MKAEEPVKVLLIEDNPADADLIEELLRGVRSPSFELATASTLSKGLAYLSKNEVDVILLDLSLPDSRGHETFAEAHSQAPSVPILVLTGLDDETLAVQTVREGAQDYLAKGPINGILLERSIRYAIERGKVEEALRRTNVELEGFANTVSHDIKGPLYAIEMASNILPDLLKKPPTEEIRKDLDESVGIIRDSVMRSIALVEDLLSLAKAGQKPEDASDIAVSEVVERILEERKDTIEKRGIVVKVEADLDHVIASPTQIYQLFSNLIGNAIKHNDSKSPLIELNYLGDDESGGHWYRVRDNGSGIPPEYLDQIFLPFFKGTTSETGIGLSIAEKIVKVYGGNIRAYNDNGACFEFVLRDYLVS